MRTHFKKLILALMLLACINTAFARRMSPEQMQQQSQQQADQAPAGIMCKDCPPPNIPVPPSSQRVWQGEVSDLATWQQLSKPLRDFEFSKFVLDIKTNKIYFVDSNVFALHADFVVDYLQKIPRTPQNMRRYNQNYSTKKPQFILGYITHYPQIKAGTSSAHNGLWTFSFWEGDTITAKDIARTHKKLQQTFTLAPLTFRPDSSAQEKVAKQLKPYKITSINNNQIYKAQPYIAFNTGVAVGRLNVVPVGTKYENLQFAPDEIVILQEAYPDISPVAGIVTAVPSTPLAHVNLRASAWGIPNATDVDAAERFFSYRNTWVKLEFTDKQLNISPATEQEIADAKAKLKPKQIDLPQADLSNSELSALNQINLSHMQRFGAKTVHLGAMLQAGLPVPNGFGVPFYYYQKHMAQSRMDIGLHSILKDARFKTNKTWRNKELAKLQEKIKATPINAADFAAIKKQWQTVLNSSPVFVRSSTNAEDLAGFNGAGLYDTVPNVTADAALEAAIKQVWASLWNARAVDEREFFGIAQNQVYAAVLIQTAVNANAAGVLLTTDIWGNQAGTFTINAKWGLGLRVVAGQKMAEQILYDSTNYGTRVISRSDETTMLVADKNGGIKQVSVPKTEAIITEMRAKNLGDLALKAQNLFNQYKVLDIEWVLENQAGKDVFWLVQARPYVEKKKN